MGANTYLTERERGILESARIGIAGAGGLGSNVAMLLVRAGIVKFVIADFDEVNASNLNRQFFFRGQIGEKKVEALAHNLRLIEPDLELELHDVRLTDGNVAGVFAGCDIVVEAFDAAESKTMLLDALLPLGRPVVAATGLAGWGRSNEIRTRRVGRNLVLVGDQSSDVNDGLAPQGVRVAIAAAHEANAVVSLLLGEGL
ncbi:MAG: sulfur carrier protein ThiS adenylyltransferase ThiF [Kiritimatiellae bacterium]|nr:sulfur carrier protein ThiS adenylyltransferase ThiF [Kiritimatiellia bacterium]